MRKGWLRSCRRGFTLVEVATAMGVSSVLMLGMGTALLIASRTVPGRQSRVDAAVSLAQASRTITDDLACATSFELINSRAIEFRVPDRDQDGQPELIRYEWTGEREARLTRQINAGGAAPITQSLSSAAFGFELGTRRVTENTAEVNTSDETLLSSFDGWTITLLPTITNNPVGSTSWAGQYFTIDRVSLPSSVSAVNITRVRLVMQRSVSSGTVSVAVHAVGTGVRPASIPIGTAATLAASSLPSSPGWVEFTMPSDCRVEANVGSFVIVAKGSAAGTATAQMYSSILASSDGGVAMWTTDAGATWNPAGSAQNANDHRFAVYGTYTTTTRKRTERIITTLRRVTVSLVPAISGGAPICTATCIRSEPEVTP